MKGTIQYEEMTLNVYASNARVPSYMEQILMGLNGEMDPNTIIVGAVNTIRCSGDRNSARTKHSLFRQ